MTSRLMGALLAAALVLGCHGQAGAFGLRGDVAAGPVLVAQTDGGEGLVKPSAAARAAQRVVKGKVLSIDKGDRGGPVYLVKIRGSGEVRMVVVDARTGQVVSY